MRKALRLLRKHTTIPSPPMTQMPLLLRPAALRRRLFAAAQRRFRLQLHRCTGDPACRRFTVVHRRLRKDGIFLQGQWLCSPGCLRVALVQCLSASPGAGLHAMPRLPRMPFRLILLQNGTLTQQQLTEALMVSERTGVSLGQTLLDLEFVTPATLAAALAAENGCAFYGLPPAPPVPDVELPLALAREAGAAIVHATPVRLLVGFVQRIDRDLLRAVETMTGLRAEPCFITEAHHHRQLALSKQSPEPAQAIPVSEGAALLTQQAVRMAAEKLLFARVRDHFWVRMQGSSSHRDQVIQATAEAARSDLELVSATAKKKLRAL